MNSRPVGTLESSLVKDSSIPLGRDGDYAPYPALKRRAKLSRRCRDEERPESLLLTDTEPAKSLLCTTEFFASRKGSTTIPRGVSTTQSTTRVPAPNRSFKLHQESVHAIIRPTEVSPQ